MICCHIGKVLATNIVAFTGANCSVSAPAAGFLPFLKKEFSKFFQN